MDENTASERKKEGKKKKKMKEGEKKKEEAGTADIPANTAGCGDSKFTV